MTQTDQTPEEWCRQLLTGGTHVHEVPLGLAKRGGEVLGLGWHHVSLDELGVPPTNVLLEDVLSDAIVRLNPAIQGTPDRVRAVIGELRMIISSAEASGIESARSRLVPWVIGQRALPGRIYVRLVDLGDVDQNAFAVAERRPAAGGEAAGASFVLYVNGIPLAVLATEIQGAAGEEVEEPAEAPAAAEATEGAAEPSEAPAVEPAEPATATTGDAAAEVDEGPVAPEGDAGDAVTAGEEAAAAAPDADAAEPAAVDAAASEPGAGEPGAGEPAAGEPAAGEPAAGEPGEGEPEPPAPTGPPRRVPGTWQAAAARVVRLEKDRPDLFVANVVTAATDGVSFYSASAGVEVESWREAEAGARAAVAALLGPQSVLDELASFAFSGGDEL